MENRELDIDGRSRVVVGDAQHELARLLPECRVVAISDGNIDRCHHELLAPFADVILIGTGETVKTLETAASIHRELIRRGADRATFLLGVGGGIVTDIAGFVASTYMRGVRFGFVSTTLLGNVDASVGGKNGVNVDGFKNMVGTFNQPQFVVCDTSLFATLPDREFRAGLAEALKTGIIGDAELFERIERSTFAELRTRRDRIDEIVMRSVRLKTAIVGRDECEHGERRKLNLGHTFGHAIEKCSRTMNHGEAVAAGLLIAARMAVRSGLLAQAACSRIEDTLVRLGFDPVSPVPMSQLLEAVRSDKKAEDGSIRLVLPTAIGSCEVRRLSLDALERLAESL